MILLPIVLLGILPSCLYASSVYDAVPTFQNAAVVNRHGNGSHLNTLPQLQRELFDYAMEGLDANYGAPFLFKSVRYSAWYAVALLARNEGNDVKTASSLIKNAIKYQFKDPSALWFGTFNDSPDGPTPGATYPPKLYTSYDLNQGLFVCTSWIIVMEEFQHLLAPDLVSLMKESMYNATVGDGYRVGGFHDDNLYPVYSNPWYMRVMSATYVGNMMKDANMTHWGNVWASEAITEFDRHGTLSEYNSGTYTGVSLYALSLWGYMPKNSTIVSRAPGIITKIWEDVGFFYNPTIHSLGPPWDRAYGYDMQFYFGILGAQITGLVGGISDGTAPIPLPLPAGGHYEDAAVIPLLPLTSKFHDKYVPKSVIAKLTASKSEFHTAQAVSPPFEDIANPRNYTMWKQPGLSAGGVQIDGNVVGGAARNPGAFVPASIIWQTGVEGTGVSWLNLYPTSSSISAIATSSNITITYPPSKSFPANASISNIISLAFNGIYGFDFPADFLASGSAEIPGLKLTVETNGNRTKFLYGEATLNDQKYYNLTYTFTGPETPRLVLGFEKV